MATYILGDCKICKKLKALKEGICVECQKIKDSDKVELPDTFKEIFRPFIDY